MKFKVIINYKNKEINNNKINYFKVNINKLYL